MMMAVYFVRSGKDGPVKIGYAVDVRARLIELQCGNPEEFILLRTLDGPPALERIIHRAFRPLHIRGEWFRFSETMLSLSVADLAATPGIARQPTKKATRTQYRRRLQRHQSKSQYGKLGPASEVRFIDPTEA